MTTAALTVDIDRLIADVRSLAAARPDYRQPYCQFFDDRARPMCIMGVALHKQGFTSADIDHLAYIAAVIEEFNPEADLDSPPVKWLKACQDYADTGGTYLGTGPWGYAVAHADERVDLNA